MKWKWAKEWSKDGHGQFLRGALEWPHSPLSETTCKTKNRRTSPVTFFSFPRPTDFIVNFAWLFYLLNGVHFLRIFSGLGCPRVSWPVARLPAHLQQLKNTVTLNTSKDSAKIVVPRGCLPSGALLITPVLNWK